MTNRVLSVGQCGFDHSGISRFLTSHFDVTVDAADSADDMQQSVAKHDYNLILVNRLLDRDGSPGIDLIRQLKADPQTESIPVMIVSNYAESHQEAIAAGAEQGFGKNDIGDSKTADRLATYLK